MSVGVVKTEFVDRAFPPKELAYQPIKFVPVAEPVNVKDALLTQPAIVPPETAGGEGVVHCALVFFGTKQNSTNAKMILK